MCMVWIALGVQFLLCYPHWPTAEEQDSKAKVNTSITQLDGEDEKCVAGDDDESDRVSDVFGMACEKSFDVLETNGLDGLAFVVPYGRRSSVCSSRSGVSSVRSSVNIETSSSLKHESESSGYGTVEKDLSDVAVRRPCWCRLCATIRNLLKCLLQMYSMLIWEESVIILYVIFITIFCEMIVDVSVAQQIYCTIITTDYKYNKYSFQFCRSLLLQWLKNFSNGPSFQLAISL